MKLYNLSPFDILVAILIGLVLAGAFTYISAPRMVTVQPQVITPIQTPPPVVITTAIPQQVSQPVGTCSGSGINGMVFAVIVAIVVIAMITMILPWGSGSSGLISILIGFLILTVMFMLLPIISDAILCAMPVPT